MRPVVEKARCLKWRAYMHSKCDFPLPFPPHVPRLQGIRIDTTSLTSSYDYPSGCLGGLSLPTSSMPFRNLIVSTTISISTLTPHEQHQVVSLGALSARKPIAVILAWRYSEPCQPTHRLARLTWFGSSPSELPVNAPWLPYAVSHLQAARLTITAEVMCGERHREAFGTCVRRSSSSHFLGPSPFLVCEEPEHQGRVCTVCVSYAPQIFTFHRSSCR
jgi:hypothetical protein